MRRYLPIVVGLVVGVVCARLGVWQLDRLDQRRTFNRGREERLALEPIVLGEGGSERGAVPEDLEHRRVIARGRFAFARQVLEMARSHRGAPGAFVLTPLAIDGGPVVLVNRGWTYAADGRSVDLAALSEPETTTVRGVLLRPRRDALGVSPDEVITEGVVIPFLLRRTEPPDSIPAGLVPLDLPAATDGPHLSYALQWFSFALIAVVGSIILVRKQGAVTTAVGLET